jgi:hypothetical protein
VVLALTAATRVLQRRLESVIKVERRKMEEHARLVGSGSTKSTLGDLVPGERLGAGSEVLERRVVEETKVDEDLDELGETLVTEGTANDSLGFGDVVELAEGSRVAVGVADEGEGGVDVVGLGVLHQVLAIDLNELTLLVELGRVEEG